MTEHGQTDGANGSSRGQRAEPSPWATIDSATRRPRRGVDGEVRRLVDGLLSDDWRWSLACQRVLVEMYLPWLERRSVHRARSGGASWAAIARVMRRARQSVRERFAPLETAPSAGALLPPRLPESVVQAGDREYAEVVAWIRRRREADDAAATGSLVAW